MISFQENLAGRSNGRSEIYCGQLNSIQFATSLCSTHPLCDFTSVVSETNCKTRVSAFQAIKKCFGCGELLYFTLLWAWKATIIGRYLRARVWSFWKVSDRYFEQCVSDSDLFRTLLSNVKECQYTVEETFPAISSANPFQLGMVQQKVNFTYFGVCAPDVESCIHLGATPYRVVDKLPKEICGVCCARRSCHDFYPEFQKPKEKFQRNGICLLPKILSVNNSDQTGMVFTKSAPVRWVLFVAV